MRAALLAEHGEPLDVREVNEPKLTPHSALVEVDACGICRTDWHGWRGSREWLGLQAHPGQILGHEPAGTVAEVGDEVESVRRGDRVAVPFHLGDGVCPQCQRGRSNTCESLLPLGFTPVAQGGFAEYVRVPRADHNAVELPSGVSPVEMAGVGCRFPISFHALAHRADVGAGDWVAIHGGTPIGLAAAHVADALGANAVVVDPVDERLDLAADLGAETINPDDVPNVSRAIRAIADGGVDVSVDVGGPSMTTENATRCLRTRGRYLPLGLPTVEVAEEISVSTELLMSRELELVGSAGMPVSRYDELWRMVANGKIDPTTLVSETVSLEEVSERLAAMGDREVAGVSVVDEF